MSTTDWAVVLTGVVGILWVNWYFFLASGRSAAASASSSGVAEVTIEVRGGYDPAEVRVRKGTPLRVIFDRQETSGCSEEVVLPDFGIRRFLPAHRRTAIELTPREAGSFEFTCGMGMLRGRIVVED